MPSVAPYHANAFSSIYTYRFVNQSSLHLLFKLDTSLYETLLRSEVQLYQNMNTFHHLQSHWYCNVKCLLCSDTAVHMSYRIPKTWHNLDDRPLQVSLSHSPLHLDKHWPMFRGAWWFKVTWWAVYHVN